MNAACIHIDIMRECTTNNFGLLSNFLRHEMTMISFINQECPCSTFLLCTFYDCICTIMNCDALAREHNPIAFFKIGDCVSKRCER